MPTMPSDHTLPLSAAIVAKNEADRIGACLESLTFVNDIVVVVDEGSHDGTLEIARAHGCRTVSRPWAGYAKQKQHAVDLAANEWVLILDADERVPEGTAGVLVSLMAHSPTDIVAFGLARKNYFHGRWIRRCGWWPDRVVRVVNKKRGRFSSHHVHEQWLADGRVDYLNAEIEHHSFNDYAALIEKMQNYSTLAALQMESEGRRVRWWTPISHGVWTFFRTYLLERGVLEGFDGLMISICNAGGSYLKYAKLWELWHYGSAQSNLKAES